MALYDQHLHSYHSMDSQTDPAANVEAAISKGLAGLTFTEHFDTHPDDWDECVYDDEAYSATIRRLRDQYGSHLFIGKGIEVCYQPDRMEFILDFLDRHEFDLVMLSVHYFGDQPIHRRESWKELPVEQGTDRYLRGVLAATTFCERLHAERGRVFDVLGHLDLAKRYTQRYFDCYDICVHTELIDSILEKCLAADLVPEINTSSLRQGLDETMPGLTTAARYAKLGGTMMSLGSDAHKAADIGAGFEEAATMLREAGIGRIPLFRQRERTTIELC